MMFDRKVWFKSLINPYHESSREYENLELNKNLALQFTQHVNSTAII